MIIGQKKLLEQLNQYNIDTFPRTILLLGEKGIGKHTIANYIKDTIINLPLADVTEIISKDFIDEIYRNPNPSIYLIDVSVMKEEKQNIMLKLIEEPLNNAFIILLAEDSSLVLNTIRNRCIIFEFEPYSKDELQKFITNEIDVDLILKVLRTPGKILSTNINNLKEAYDIADKIANKLTIANYANTLTIIDNINFKDNYSKIDLDIFLDVLVDHLFNCYYNTGDVKYLKMYLFIIRKRKIITLDRRINKEQFFENFLTNLWLEVRKESD